MPTIFSHAALPLAVGLALGAARIPRRLMVAGIAVSMLPDLDVLAFWLGIPYAHALGHRGFSHALLTAAAVGMLATLARHWFRAGRVTVFLFISLAMASHGLLDMCTDGGKGVALLWPWSDARLFAPWRVIEVSPIGVSRFLSARGLEVVRSELLWIWLPAMGLAVILRGKYIFTTLIRTQNDV